MDFDTMLEETKDVRSAAMDIAGALDVPGVGIINDGMDLYSQIAGGNNAEAFGTGLGMVSDGVGLADDVGVEGAGPVGDVLTAAKGGWDIGAGAAQISNDDFDGKGCDGVRSVIEGAGGLAELFGPKGKAIGKGLSAGLSVGDAIAPLVYGGDGKGSEMQKPPADGVWKATTGNDTVDWLFGVD